MGSRAPESSFERAEASGVVPSEATFNHLEITEINMALFRVEAVDGKGNKVKRDVDAVDRDDALAKIKEVGLFPTKVKETEGGAGPAVAVAPKKREGKVLTIGSTSGE